MHNSIDVLQRNILTQLKYSTECVSGRIILHTSSTVAQLVARWALDRSNRVQKLGRDNCVEALSPHRVTAVGKLLTLNCLGGDWPSFTFMLTLFIERLRYVSCL